MFRAIIFDFDGVIVDSEPLIFRLTQGMAAQEGWKLTEAEYYHRYLALDDAGIIEELYRSHGRTPDPIRRQELVAWKAKTYMEAIRHGLPLFPGALEFIRKVAAKYPLAIASGSLRQEVEYLLTKADIRDQFAILATAEDTSRSKPAPEIYSKALERLRSLPTFAKGPLGASDCLTIEDAPAGIVAAHAAGMKCLALAHSRPAGELRHADWVCRNFVEVVEVLPELALEASGGQ